jgi:hypothetical protein
MFWMAVGVLALAAVVTLILRAVVGPAASDLGSVSAQWIAQHRSDT